MPPGNSAFELTSREREVLVLLAQGLDQKTIAQKLVLSPRTIATHIQHILTKLGVNSRTQAVALAYREGLVADGDGAHGLERAKPAMPLTGDQGPREVAAGERMQVLRALPDPDDLHG